MEEHTSRKPDHLWRHHKNHSHSSKAYIDTNTCFETIFRSSSNVTNNENIMMVTHHMNQPDTLSFFVPKQNTSDENVLGSKYLLVPAGAGSSPSTNTHIPTGNAATHHNAHGLHHQYSLPNHSAGYHRGSVAERSSSIITEHSGTSETPPMIEGECYRGNIKRCNRRRYY